MIAILARTPQAGRCKTRLIPKLGATGAARLHAWLLRDTVRRMRATGVPITVWATPRTNHAQFLRLRRLGVRVRRQRRGHLGQRMQHAMDAMHTEQARTIVGTDCPALTTKRLQELMANIRPSVIPAKDGGYVAIHMHSARPVAFAGVDWGTGRVLKQTQRNLRRCGGGRTVHPALPDLDHPRDYRRQRQSGLIPAQAVWCRSA